MLLNENNLHAYQGQAVQHILNNPYSALFMEMGLGKSISTLTAINQLMFEDFEVDKVLIIAPKRVAESTWSDEIEKWEHVRHLKMSIVLGNERQRKEALRAKADIYIINRENVAWLVGYYQSAFPFDMVVIDELSSFKSAKAIRFKALKMIRPKVKRVVGLTGTPAPNGLIDLWPQLYLLDLGERLGKTITRYRQLYFSPGRSNGHVIYDYRLKADSEKAIYNQISDICISMKTKDYLQLPGRIDRTTEIKLSPSVQAKYEEFEKEQILVFNDENLEDISAVNAAVLSNKLLQFANGAVYNADREWYEVHKLKLEALSELVEAANGQPVLVFYSFKHDLARIQKHLKAYKPKKLETRQDIKDWNAGRINLMLAHPASAGHGLNLQAGGNVIIWFGLTWSLELYQQANARLDRQGQTKPVIIHHLIISGSMDEDVMKSIEGKAKGQDSLMNAVKARILKYRKKIKAA